MTIFLIICAVGLVIEMTVWLYLHEQWKPLYPHDVRDINFYRRLNGKGGILHERSGPRRHRRNGRHAL